MRKRPHPTQGSYLKMLKKLGFCRAPLRLYRG
jgi:hypothetical protein